MKTTLVSLLFGCLVSDFGYGFPNRLNVKDVIEAKQVGQAKNDVARRLGGGHHGGGGGGGGHDGGGSWWDNDVPTSQPTGPTEEPTAYPTLSCYDYIDITLETGSDCEGASWDGQYYKISDDVNGYPFFETQDGDKQFGVFTHMPCSTSRTRRYNHHDYNNSDFYYWAFKDVSTGRKIFYNNEGTGPNDTEAGEEPVWDCVTDYASYFEAGRRHRVYTLYSLIGCYHECDESTSTTEPETTQAQTTQAETTQAETTQAETTQAETTQAETTQAETTQAETTQTETTQAETTQAETTQAETTQAETTQAETTQAETTQAETTQGETTQAETTQAATTQAATSEPTDQPTERPTSTPTERPTSSPTERPTASPLDPATTADISTTAYVSTSASECNISVTFDIHIGDLETDWETTVKGTGSSDSLTNSDGDSLTVDHDTGLVLLEFTIADGLENVGFTACYGGFDEFVEDCYKLGNGTTMGDVFDIADSNLTTYWPGECEVCGGALTVNVLIDYETDCVVLVNDPVLVVSAASSVRCMSAMMVVGLVLSFFV